MRRAGIKDFETDKKSFNWESLAFMDYKGISCGDTTLRIDGLEHYLATRLCLNDAKKVYIDMITGISESTFVREGGEQ